jgi:hypothetical protein
MCEMYTWRKSKHIHKRQIHLLVNNKDSDIKGLVEKNSPVVSLKRLEAMMNWLGVNRQS